MNRVFSDTKPELPHRMDALDAHFPPPRYKAAGQVVELRTHRPIVLLADDYDQTPWVFPTTPVDAAPEAAVAIGSQRWTLIGSIAVAALATLAAVVL